MMNGSNVAMREQQMRDHDHGCHPKCISWSAIVVGALVGIGISFLLNLFSVAIGLTAFNTTQEGVMTLAIGGLIGVGVGTIVATFVGGWVAGYLGGKRKLGILYGFAAWCVALLIMAAFAAHIGRYVTAYNDFVSKPNYMINVNNNDTTPMVSTNNSTNPPQATVNAEKATNAVGMGAFVMFILFFLGAIASAFGGHCGVCCREDECIRK